MNLNVGISDFEVTSNNNELFDTEYLEDIVLMKCGI